MAAAKKKKTGRSARPDFRWIALIFLVTVLISALMSFVSSNLLEGAGLILSFVILIRNANRVSSFCNDVIGDICGVISGSAAAVISARVLLLSKSGSEIFITLLLSAVVSGVTVGGKACGKSLAMNSSTAVVRTAAKVLCFFRTLPQRLEKKSAKK